MSGSIRVQANGQTLAVNFTRTNGAAASVFSDAGLTSAVSLPATISSDTYFYFPTPETYVVSVKLNGVEIASNAGGTLTQFLHGNASTTIAPSVDGFTERAAVDAGAYASLSTVALVRWRQRRRENYQRDNLYGWDRYVDSVGGLDTNDGLTPATPWQTLAKINAMGAALTAGMRVGLKRGSTFREAFTVPTTAGPGTPNARIVFGAYGVGKPPCIKGSVVLALTWTAAGGGKYTAPTASNPVALFMDTDTVLPKAASAGAVTAGTFFADGTTMTAWLPDGTSPTGHTIEATSSTATLLTCAVSYVTFQDIAWKHGKNNNVAILFNATANLSVGMQVKRCDIGPNVGSGLLMGVAGGLVEDCYVHDCYGLVDYPSGLENGAMSFTTNTDGTEVRYNYIVGGYKGIRGANNHANLLIHHNIVIRPNVNGIDATQGVAGKPVQVYNNFVWHRTTTGNGHAYSLQAGNASVGEVCKNNIAYCDDTFASPPNLELYTIDATTYVGVDWSNNIGYRTPASTASYGKVGLTQYATAAAYVAAFQAAYGATQETGSREVDPALDMTTFVPTPGSPCLNAGVVVGGVVDAYLGLADYLGSGVDVGPFEVS